MAVAIGLVVAAPGTAPASASTRTEIATPHTAAATPHTQREIFGFALASSLADPTVGYPTWNFNLLSTVAFFGLHVGSAGQIAGDSGWTVWNSSALTSLVSVAHQHGTKVVVTVILQDFSPNTPNMCDGLMHPDATVAQTVNEVKAKGVDGVNLDYEGLDGSCGTNDPYWAQHSFTVLAQKMRAGLGSSYYLSVDTYASSASDGYGFFDVANLATYVDSFFVMAYDLEYSNYSRSPSSCPRFCLGPTGPLNAYYYNDSTVATQYMAAVGAGKVILGVPYYGRKACVGAAVPNGFPTSSVIADSYLDAVSEGSDPAVRAGSYAAHRDAYSSGSERWDTWYNTSLGCTRELYWDDATSLGKKYDLVNSAKLRGAGIWNLNYGGAAPELWSALATHFGGCSGVSMTFAPTPPANAGTVVTITGAATGCTYATYEFWMRPATSSAWQMVQAYSSSPTYHWNTTGASSGTVYFGVWARAVGSGASADVITSAPFGVITPCTSAAVRFTPSFPSKVGSAVIISATSTGCASPLYEFWIRTAPSATWQMVQGYSASPTYRWDTTGASSGTVDFGVWAKDASSPAASDVTVSAPYDLYTPCASVSVSPAPSSPTSVGSAVTLTAAAAGCANPVYEFWMRPATSSTWQLVQAYSASPTYRWNSTGASSGTVYLGAWARDAKSTAVSDATISIPYAVFTKCGAANLAFSPVPPLTHGSGTTVTVSATASGCASALYEFWMRPATSSTWQLVQGYSTSPTYRWNTNGAPAGTVYFGVWVRDPASMAGFDSAVSLPFALS